MNHENPNAANRHEGHCHHLLTLFLAVGLGLISVQAAQVRPGPDVTTRGQRLIAAVKDGNRDAVRTLLSQSSTADVNVSESDGTTALHWAVRADDVETVRMLLKAGANAKVASRNGVTPLLLAATNGNAVVVEALLKAGADPKASLSEGQTILMTAARTGSVSAVNALLTNGADVHARERVLGENALIWAAMENHGAVVKALVASGAEVNARSNRTDFPEREFGDGKSGRLTVLPAGGWTPLMYAARQNAVDAARALAESGADLNLADPDGTTALLVAVINAHYDLAELLLENGADPNIGDVTGMTPLYAAVDLNTFADTPGRPAPRPTGRLDTPGLIKVLLAHRADPNARLKAPILVRVHDRGDPQLGEGATPLMRAAKKSDTDVMRVLLDAGADPRLSTRTGATALALASGLGGAGRFAEYDARQVTEADQIEAARLCLDHGADVNAVNEAGQTAMHAAVAGRDAEFVRFLVGRGARLDVKDRQGRTPLDVAMGIGGRGRGGAPPVVRESMVSLLRQLMGVGGQSSTAR
jgi:ankyrin repeat protein